MHLFRRLFSIAALCGPLLALAQPEVEPNDNTGQANVLTLGTARNGDIGGAPCASGTSDDVFSVNLASDGLLTISTNASNSGTGAAALRVIIYNSGGGQIALFDHATGANGLPSVVASTLTCAAKGVYYFRLQSLNGGVCYTYGLTVAQSVPVYGDDLEPNNTFPDADANPLLAANTNTEGHINFLYNAVNNDDRYRIQTSGDGVLNVTISAEAAGAGALRLIVFNGGGGQINLVDVPVGTGGTPITTTQSFNCYGQGTYYFLLQSLGPCGISYQLSHTRTPPVYANDAEPNNSFPTAVPLAHNTYTQGRINFSHYGDNDDRYAITTPAEGTITVTMIAEHAGGSASSIRTILYNSGGGQIDLFDSPVGAASDDDTTVVSFTCYGQGQYYLLVQSLGACGTSYKLKYQTTGAVYTNDVEPNNTFPLAVSNGVLAHNTFTEGHINFSHYGDNDDRYYIQTPAEGTMEVTMIAERVPSTAGAIRLILYNGGGGQIDLFDSPVGGNNDDDTTVAVFNCYGQGDYYMLVQSIGGCGFSYRLKYRIIPAVYANDSEPNNTFPTALPLAPNTNTEGHINFSHYGDNDDRYVINTPGAGTVNITMIAERVPAVSGTVRLIVFNSGAGQINLFDSPVGGSNDDDTTTVSFTCYAQSTYYFLVQSLSGCGASYKLGYTVTPPAYGADVEPNGSFPTAIVLNPDSSNASGHLNFSHPNENDDRYRVVLPALGSIQFNFSAEAAAAGSLRIICFNGGGGQIGLQDVPVGGSGTPVTTPVSFGPFAAGTYYLLLQSIGPCGISYRFNCNDNDNDGTCNYFDLCPGGPEPGTACNDNNACTTNDVIQANCGCAGTAITCNDNDPCTTDSCNPLSGCVFTPVPDSDGDGSCDAIDGCPADANKTSPGTCGCGNPEPGATCNDNNPLTINDVIGANCLCAGTPVSCTVNGDCNDNNPCTSDACVNNSCVFTPLPDSDNDGTCDATDGCPNDPNKIAPGNCGCGNPEPGAACNDNNACTVNDVIGANCQCAGTFADADNDGTCDANDVCQGPEPGSPCSDFNACTTGDVINALCACVGTFQDSDNDGTCDANDLCPGGPEPGTACNDNNANTSNDVIGANCLCAGTPNNSCTENLTLKITLDNFGSQTTWNILDATNTVQLLAGGPYINGVAGTIITENICLPVGCYQLNVFDSFGDGITGGGYILRDANNRRIIDADGQFAATSTILPNFTTDFCVPLGPTHIKPNWCDRTDLVLTSFIYCQGVANATAYQFWFFDPHGSYSRRIAQPITYVRLSQLQTSPIPAGLELNVRVRALVNGNYTAFGKACTLMMQPPGIGGGNQQAQDATEPSASLLLYPNPVNDGRVALRIEDLITDVETPAEIMVFDALGRNVFGERTLAAGGEFNHIMDLGTSLGKGMYFVNVNIGNEQFSQRLLVD